MGKSNTGSIFDVEDGRSLVDVQATQNTFVQRALARAAELTEDPVTQKQKPPSQTGQTAAQTKSELDDIYSSIDNVYDSITGDATSMASKGRPTPVRYSDKVSRMTDPEDSTGLSKSDAAAVGQAQTSGQPMMANPRFDNAKLGTDPDLNYDEEKRLLETFANEAGVDPKDVATDPRLYEAFGRYLGMATGTLNNERYWAYDLQGNNRKDSQGKDFKTWTPFVQPKFVEQVADIGTEVKDNALAQQFRGDEASYVKKLVAKGVPEGLARQSWKQQGEIDTNTPLLGRAELFKENDPSSPLSIRDPSLIRAGDMGDRMHKTMQSFVRSLHKRGPSFAGRFSEKITGERYKDFKGESIQDMVNLFIMSYAALEENSQMGARAWSDIIMLSVLDHSLRNVYRYEQKKSMPEAGEMSDEQTAEGIERFDRALMTGATDQSQIGGTVLSNMGFNEASIEQKEAMGTMAMDMVFQTFQEAQKEGDKEYSLFTKKEMTDPETGNQLVGHTLTSAGLAVAHQMHDLFAAVMPSSVRDVRYNTMATDKTAINKLIGTPIGKRVYNTKTRKYEFTDNNGLVVPFGNTAKAARDKQQADNTPTRIHHVTADFWESLYKQYQADVSTLGSQAGDGSALLELLDDGNFYNMKGDGTGNKGVFQNRTGFVYVSDRSGRFYHEDSPHLNIVGEKEVRYTDNDGRSTDNAATQMDFSDKVKDQQFINTIQFAVSNRDKVFYYTYKYGKNWRLNVDQTVGNYQHNKFARSLIAAGVPAQYDLTDVHDVVTIKAGIMKRFGMDMKNPIAAAIEYDANIEKWMALDAAQDKIGMLKIAGKEEGFASVTAMLEGIKLKKALDTPNHPTYTSNFFTEIDGKTNGLAHASAQSGDMRTGTRALIFNDKDYTEWNKYYDEFEKVKNNPELVRSLAEEHGLDPDHFNDFLDAYNQVNDQLLDKFKDIKAGRYADGRVVTFPNMISQTASYAMKQKMKDAQEHGGLDNFNAAMDLFGQSNLGRSFTKKPVMIFAYGAGDARHLEEVRAYIDAIMKREGNAFQQKFSDLGIDIDTDFIIPLGVMMSEAVNQNFKSIKTFANALSAMGAESVNQGFDLFIPTMDGQLIPIGDSKFWLSKEPGDQRQATWVTPDGTKRKIVAKHMKRAWDSEAGRDLANGMRILKAATQMAVMMTHANDNINMQTALGREHDNKLAERIAAGEDLSNQELPYGNTALHIFDGLLVTPKDAERYANTLNDVFKEMNVDQDYSHMQNLYNAITYELNSNGEKVQDVNYENDPIYFHKNADGSATNRKYDKGHKDYPSPKLITKHFYRRRLKPSGKQEAKAGDLSTWDTAFARKEVGGKTIRPAQAFDWTKKGVNDAKGRYIKGPADYYHDFFKSAESILGAKRTFEKDKTHYHQFFYSTADVRQQIKDYVENLSYMTKDSKGNPRKKAA